ALHLALLHPERVEALILISPAVYTGGGAPGFVRPLLQTPQLRRIGPLLVREFLGEGAALLDSAWHDPSKITAELQEGYTRPLRAENWDKGLWEMTIAADYPDLVSQLENLQAPVLIITGDDDRIVPTADSVRLAEEIPGAELVVIPDSGHVAHEETPGEVMAAIEDFLTRVTQ
ncbi:MAG: alpha/beta hydrolase, partial [Anaerolineae bacterium]|nr:alpha/beta hydrolase [Anaerolineae bacterium]